MAITNKYILFANEATGRLTETEYENLPDRNSGFVSGTPIVSKNVNTVLYANSLVANTVANFIQVQNKKDTATLDLNTTVEDMTTYLTNALRSNIEDSHLYLETDAYYGWQATSIVLPDYTNTMVARYIANIGTAIYADRLLSNKEHDDTNDRQGIFITRHILPYPSDNHIYNIGARNNAQLPALNFHFSAGYFNNLYLGAGASEWDSKANINKVEDRYDNSTIKCLTYDSSGSINTRYISGTETVTLPGYGLYLIQATTVHPSSVSLKEVYNAYLPFMDSETSYENNVIKQYLMGSHVIGNNNAIAPLYAENNLESSTYVELNRQTKVLSIGVDNGSTSYIKYKVYRIMSYSNDEISNANNPILLPRIH